MSLKNWRELTIGGVNPEPGNMQKKITASFRSGKKPVFTPDNCTNCFFCWVFCPENAIIIDREKVTGINYDYCKGCGICENECPIEELKPITMEDEQIEY